MLIPDLEAGCSLSDMITAEALRQWKAEHPGAVVVSYVNTSAEVKAESDYCCTSSNAVKVVESIPADKEILFVPDMYLGQFRPGKDGTKNPFMAGLLRRSFPHSDRARGGTAARNTRRRNF